MLVDNAVPTSGSRPSGCSLNTTTPTPTRGSSGFSLLLDMVALVVMVLLCEHRTTEEWQGECDSSTRFSVRMLPCSLLIR